MLGSFNWMLFGDVAGLQPRLDDVVELWPIDMGYDHFAIGNLSYHGSDVTIVWQRPGGTTYYPQAPAGYSLYVDGKRAFTVDDLAHVTWNSHTGAVNVLDGSDTHVLFSAALSLKAADQVSLTANARVVDDFQKAGVDLTPITGPDADLAQGKAASASFTTTSPAAQATDPANAVDGFTISGLPVTSGAYVGTDPIWGDLGSPNTQDWLQVDLGSPTRFDSVKLYFYDNKAFGSGGGTYRPPSDYSIQAFNGTSWVDVPGQAKAPAGPAPNLNEVHFPPITAQLVRVLVTRQSGFAVGLKEVQVFDTPTVSIGPWKNALGQNALKTSSSTAGVCDSGTWLRQYAPFQDLSPTASCDEVAGYVANVITGANCGGKTCNAMLKAQMLTVALDVYFDDVGAGVPVDLTKVCTDVPTCTSFENDATAFAGASSRTVSQLLADAAGQSNVGGSTWYGNVKATQVAAKDVFNAVNAQVATAP